MAQNIVKSVEKVVNQTNTMSYELPKNTNALQYPKVEFKVDAAFPIRILDSMIDIEEKMQNGFSLYNRGENLKKSLIDPKRVKDYLMNPEGVLGAKLPQTTKSCKTVPKLEL